MKKARWWYRRWRARHYVHLAYCDWYRHPDRVSHQTWRRSLAHYARVVTAGP